MTEEVKQKNKGGRPKKEGGYTDATASRYLELCKEGKTLSQIASDFKVTEKELLKWANDPKKSKLHTCWELGRTYCQAFHEAYLDEMIKDKKVYSHQINSQQHRMAVMFKDWNLKKESKVTVTNRYDDMTEAELDKEVMAMIKRKTHKEFLLNVLGDNGQEDTGTSESTH